MFLSIMVLPYLCVQTLVFCMNRELCSLLTQDDNAASC